MAGIVPAIFFAFVGRYRGVWPQDDLATAWYCGEKPT
jgi:hypothetical protein